MNSLFELAEKVRKGELDSVYIDANDLKAFQAYLNKRGCESVAFGVVQVVAVRVPEPLKISESVEIVEHAS